jgi:type I restriction enzyme S subunit
VIYPKVSLSEVVDIFSGFAWKAELFNKDSLGIPIIRIQNVGQSHNDFIYWNEPYDEKFIINKGDLLLSLSGSFRIAIWNDREALLNQRIVRLTPKNKVLDKN